MEHGREEFLRYSLRAILKQTFMQLSDKFDISYAENLPQRMLDFKLIYDKKIIAVASGDMNLFVDHTITDMIMDISGVFSSALESFFKTYTREFVEPVGLTETKLIGDS